MKLLFVQGGSRVRICKNGKLYVDGNFNNNIWERYKYYCDELVVVLRKIDATFEEEKIKEKLNWIDTNLLTLKLVDDIYSPKKDFLNIKKRIKIEKEIKENVKNADRIIIRSIGNYYTNTALKYCKKYKKEYLIEVTGFALDSLWYHSFFGKIVAIPRELKLKKSVKEAPYVVYVTDKELQKRYPSNGKMLGCSDVELFDECSNILEAKKRKIKKDISEKRITIGTIGFLDVKYKGQTDVIKAISLLKKTGINSIFYEMVGTGKGKRIKKLINKYKLNENVKIIGALKHKDVGKWLSNIDIYVHPSYTEGLCRSIIEAMGLACPVICTNAGGNRELISSEFIYKKTKWKQLSKKIVEIATLEKLLEQSKINYYNSKKYDKNDLNKKRDKFYMKFTNKI